MLIPAHIFLYKLFCLHHGDTLILVFPFTLKGNPPIWPFPCTLIKCRNSLKDLTESERMEKVVELCRSYISSRLFLYIASGDPLHCITSLGFWNEKMQHSYLNHLHFLISCGLIEFIICINNKKPMTWLCNTSRMCFACFRFLKNCIVRFFACTCGHEERKPDWEPDTSVLQLVLWATASISCCQDAARMKITLH